ncbi:MAG: VOC family protein [Acidobacteria bacterium]|nr:VOC family protein [Acidobacteriota bacterium]
MVSNRSMPAATVIPVLGYPDVAAAARWLCEAFGFEERLRIGDHRIQLHAGDGGAVVVVRAGRPGQDAAARAGRIDSVMVRVADVRSHCARARSAGASIVQEPTDFPYGERQYSAIDPAGHAWTFSESIADVDPASWGGTLMQGTGPQINTDGAEHE